ncbi:MAG: ATP-binding protein [Cytophagales bacterium]|nr:ATP-binding protein [Cytophagales bacterium]
MTNRITISCSKDNLPKIRKFVGSVLNENKVAEVEAHKIILAVDEVCANLIIHANECNPSHNLDLTIKNDSKNIVFKIKDKGMAFDFTKYKEPSMDEIVSTRRKGGLGLMLVRRIMDKIEFTTEKNYNICTLIKKL